MSNHKDFQCRSFVEIIVILQLAKQNQFDGPANLDTVNVSASRQTIKYGTLNIHRTGNTIFKLPGISLFHGKVHPTCLALLFMTHWVKL